MREACLHRILPDVRVAKRTHMPVSSRPLMPMCGRVPLAGAQGPSGALDDVPPCLHGPWVP